MPTSESVLTYFLSFAQLENKMNKQEKKTLMVLLKLLFFTGLLYWSNSFVGTELFFFFHVFVIRETSNTSETHKCRGEGDRRRDTFPGSPRFSRGRRSAGFTLTGGRGCGWCFVCLQCMWPAGDRETGPSHSEPQPLGPSHSFLLLFVFHFFRLDSWCTYDGRQSKDKGKEALAKSCPFPQIFPKLSLEWMPHLWEGRAPQAFFSVTRP